MDESPDHAGPAITAESGITRTTGSIPGSGALPGSGKPVDVVSKKDTPVLFFARPHILSFSRRYLLACTPVILVGLSVFTRPALEGAVRGFIPKMPGALATVLPGETDLSLITFFLLAPVFLFILVACIGYELRWPEVWISTSLAFVLSIAVGSAFVFAYPGTVAEPGQLLNFLQWTAYLVQPFSFLATILVIAGLEMYRRSVSYTISETGVTISSGLFSRSERTIPVQMIGRVDVSQGFLGRWLNFGTVIPRGITGGDYRQRVRGGGETKDAFGSSGTSPGPADCLYGIPDPGKAEELLIQLVSRAKNS